MKRTNPETGKPFKQGDVRSDGYIFRSYALNHIKRDGYFKERWCNPESFMRQTQQSKEWHLNNPERLREFRAKWAQVNRDKKAMQDQRWAEQNRERSNAHKKRWNKQNAGAKRALDRKRFAAQKQRTPVWLDVVDCAEMEFTYIWCNALRSCGLDYHVDHIVPLQGKIVSGLHVPSNLQVIPAKLNLSKHNRWDNV
jgi:hypothetical protein